MGNLFAELKRRHIYRVAAAYAVVAWVLVQLVNNLAPIFDLPPWIARAIVLLLIVGFPVVLFFAWMRELAPADGATTRAATGKADWCLMGALVVVIALVSYQQLAPSSGLGTAQRASVLPQASLPAQSNGISIAVLPFANLSGDAEQEFFSDGMTDEIASALAKVPALRMVGRTSAFQFKGQSKDLRAIGQSLGATYLIEGTVRKAGNRVRITAQLVKSNDGIGLWTENYDRELTDVFATQDDIATAIAGALQVPLGLKSGENLVNNRTKNQVSYEDYLRAKALLRQRNARNVAEAVKLLEQAVARDPDFAPAWGQLGIAYQLIPRFDPVRFSGATEQARPIVEASLAKAEGAAQRAIRLDPKNADGYEALANIQKSQGRYVAAIDFYLRALALDTDNPEHLNVYSIGLAELGFLKQALPVRERLQALELSVPLFNRNFALMLWASGQTDAALAIFKNPAPGIEGGFANPMVYASQGRYGEAADRMQSFRTDDAVLSGQRDAAVRLLRAAPSSSSSPQALPKLGDSGWVYLYAGAPERALEYHEGNVKIGYSGGLELVPLWAPSFAPVRKTERFKAFVRAAGMVDYWRAKGWPDLCRPAGADDFVCD